MSVDLACRYDISRSPQRLAAPSVGLGRFVEGHHVEHPCEQLHVEAGMVLLAGRSVFHKYLGKKTLALSDNALVACHC